VAGVAAVGGAFAGDSGQSQPPTALVVDAAAARDGRDLVDDRLQSVAAAVRLPRTRDEAETNVRYFGTHGYRVIVAGELAGAGARAADVAAVEASDLESALARAGR
jgi:hypothetical protein